jgi:hypothetical protein
MMIQVRRVKILKILFLDNVSQDKIEGAQPILLRAIITLNFVVALF